MAQPTGAGRSARASFVALLAGALGSLLAFGACRSPALRPQQDPVRLTIGYGGVGPGAPGALNVLGGLLSRERLIQIGQDGRIQAALAEHWDQSADGLTWRFTLRPNLTFHDGSPIDAAIVAERLSGCERQITNAGCRDIISIAPEDTRTIVVRLRAPSGLLADALGGILISRDAKGLVGSGPFRMVSSDTGGPYEAFSGYFQGRPSIDQVALKQFPNARNAWSALMRNEIDMLYEVPPDAIEFIEQSSNTQVRSALRAYVYAMVLNARHPILAARETRRALSLAVNRTEIIQRVLRGRGYPATDHVWPRHWAYHHELPRLRYDPAEAIRLLDARGRHMPAVSHAQTPARFRFTCLILETDDRFERMALLLQRQLLEVGVDMQIQPVSAALLPVHAAAGDFDAFLVDLAAGTGIAWPYQFWRSPEGRKPLVNAGYTAADQALDGLRRARTDEETRAAMRELQRVLREDPPAVFLNWSETAHAVSARFRVPLASNRDIFRTLPQWQLAPPAEP